MEVPCGWVWIEGSKRHPVKHSPCLYPEVGCYSGKLLSSLGFDVTACGVYNLRWLCVSPTYRFLAFPALEEVDDIARLAGGYSSYVEGLASALKPFSSPNVLACEAPSVATRAAAEVRLLN